MKLTARELVDFANDHCLHISEVPGWEESGYNVSDFVYLMGTPYETVYVGLCNWEYLGYYSYEEQDILISRDMYRNRINLALSQNQLESITPDTTWEELESQVWGFVKNVLGELIN